MDGTGINTINTGYLKKLSSIFNFYNKDFNKFVKPNNNTKNGKKIKRNFKINLKTLCIIKLLIDFHFI